MESFISSSATDDCSFMDGEGTDGNSINKNTHQAMYKLPSQSISILIDYYTLTKHLNDEIKLYNPTKCKKL